MSLRKLGIWVVALALALPAWASGKPGSISGFVRTPGGVPQMGAVVEVFSSAAGALTVFTDEQGFYSAADLVPGIYSIKVSAPSFLPAWRERVGLRSGASLVINLTLSTIFDSLQVAPRPATADEDDWKWTLRSVSNRPILRVVDPAVASAAAEPPDHILKATVSFLAGAGAEGYGGTSDMSTAFSVERSLFTSGTLALGGTVGYSTLPATVLRAAYSHRMPNGSSPQVALTMRRFASPDVGLHDAVLQALALSMSDTATIADVLELKFGSEVQTIQFMGRVNAFRPFGSADLHLSPNTVLEYQYASSVPNTRLAKGFDSAPADLSETGPRLSVSNFSSGLERAHHQEVSFSRRMDKTNLQIAVYTDRIANTALTGVGEPAIESGEVLPDIYSGTFTYRGQNLQTQGLRVVLQRKLMSDLTATLDYGYGGVLDLDASNVAFEQARSYMHVVQRHALAAQMSGVLPKGKTRWVASYKWTSGQALTPVDMFNSGPGQTDPFLNVFIRQPIPKTGFLPGRMEALIDIRNLLAQGYVPLLSQDGHTVYLVQSARSIRGGVAFSF